MPVHSAFFISDGTGLTVSLLGNSLLSQFEIPTMEKHTLAFIDTIEKARGAVARIRLEAQESGVKPLVLFTLMNEASRQVLNECSEAFVLDAFSSLTSQLEQALEQPASQQIGRSHEIQSRKSYSERIEAVNYTLAHDDGDNTKSYERARIILAGISRTGKTPTSLYLALQYGLSVANYPLTEDELEKSQLPPILVQHTEILFALTISPARLHTIRSERMAGSRYASMRQCQFEINEAESLFRQHNISILDTTDRSIEEISSQILATMQLESLFNG